MHVVGLLNIVVFLLAFTVGGQVFKANTLWPPYWMRTAWMSSLVHDDFLYLTGGATSVTSKTYPKLWTKNLYFGSLMRIDLKSSWTTSDVTAEYSDKPSQYPYGRGQNLWTDGTHIYTFGGIPQAVPSCETNCVGYLWHGKRNVTNPSLSINLLIGNAPHIPWRVPIASFGNVHWEDLPHLAPPEINAPKGALATTYGNKQYALGGFSGWPYWSTYDANGVDHPNRNKLSNRQGIVSWNSDGSNWQNQSSTEFSQNGAVSLGGAVATPFGPEGTIIFLGGYSGGYDRSFAFGGTDQPLQDLSRIPIYDIKSGQFTHQTATGEIPVGRWAPCMAGVSETSSKTFDIYFYGGAVTNSINGSYSSSAATIYVLSLPSFVWNYAKLGGLNDMRMAHTCEVVGQSQMIMVGGTDPTDINRTGDTPDPWPNGIGIFDLNEWKWKSKYDAKAPAYKRPQVLVDLNEKTPYPKKWDSDFPKMLFNPDALPYDPPKPPKIKTGKGRKNKNKKDDIGGINIGAVVGGVVGGCVLLAMVIGSALCWRWRRKAGRQRKLDAEAEAEAEAVKTRKSELPGHESKGAILLSSDEKPLELYARNKSLPATPSDSSDHIPRRLFELPTAITKSTSGSTRMGDEAESENDESIQSQGSIQKTPGAERRGSLE